MARNIKKFNNKYVSNAGVEVLPYMTNETAQGRHIIKLTSQYQHPAESHEPCFLQITLTNHNQHSTPAF